VWVISFKKLRTFWVKHPEAEAPLRAFYQIIRRTNFESFAHLRQTFPSADLVGKVTVLNIGGNKFRLIAAIHYDKSRIYIRHVLTHHDYDRIYWRDG